MDGPSSDLQLDGTGGDSQLDGIEILVHRSQPDPPADGNNEHVDELSPTTTRGGRKIVRPPTNEQVDELSPTTTRSGRKIDRPPRYEN